MTHSIELLLQTAVPLIIAELQAQGGPSDTDFDEARALAPDLAAHGDVMLYGGGQPDQAGELASRLARSIAVLSFVPGGVTVFGQQWAAGRANELAPLDPRGGSGAWLYRTPRHILDLIAERGA